MWKSCSFVVLLVVSLYGAMASASTEITGLFDARSDGMGATGVAFLDSPGAIPMNPALLEQIEKMSVSLDLHILGSQAQAPQTVYHLDDAGRPYANWETIRGKRNMAYLPFLGAAFRLHDRIVFGVAAYPLLGQGARSTYHPAPDQYPNLTASTKASIGLIEAGNALSIKILENLSVGLMWRISYLTQSVSTPVVPPGAPPPAGVLLDASDPDNPKTVALKQELSGLNLKGFQIGFMYRPIRNVRLGLSYRSKVEAKGQGDTTISVLGRTTKYDTHGSFINPHSIRAGAAVSTLNDRLLLAADFKYLFYAESGKYTIQTRQEEGGEKQVTRSPQFLHDSWVVSLGTEYKATDLLALRTGYTILRSATNENYTRTTGGAPPGYSHIAAAGLGFAVLDSLSLDVSGAFTILQSTVHVATDTNAGPGKYASRGGHVSLMAVYHR